MTYSVLSYFLSPAFHPLLSLSAHSHSHSTFLLSFKMSNMLLHQTHCYSSLAFIVFPSYTCGLSYQRSFPWSSIKEHASNSVTLYHPTHTHTLYCLHGTNTTWHNNACMDVCVHTHTSINMLISALLPRWSVMSSMRTETWSFSVHYYIPSV